MTSIRSKRLLAEIKKIQHYNQTNINNIYISSYEENINKFMAIIFGPKETLYSGAILLFDISLPDEYPFQPPIFTFISPKYSEIDRIHPNLYKEGKVCLSILNTWGSKEWSSSQNIISVCETIQSLLDNDPILHEPPYNRVDINYKLAAKYMSLKMTKDIYIKKDIFPEFISEKINQNYLQNKQLYTTSSLTFNDDILNNKILSYFHGKIYINYNSISDW